MNISETLMTPETLTVGLYLFITFVILYLLVIQTLRAVCVMLTCKMCPTVIGGNEPQSESFWHPRFFTKDTSFNSPIFFLFQFPPPLCFPRMTSNRLNGSSWYNPGTVFGCLYVSFGTFLYELESSFSAGKLRNFMHLFVIGTQGTQQGLFVSTPRDSDNSRRA